MKSDGKPWYANRQTSEDRLPRDRKVSISVSRTELAAIIRSKRPGQSTSDYLRESLPSDWWQQIEDHLRDQIRTLHALCESDGSIAREVGLPIEDVRSILDSEKGGTHA